MKNCDSCGAEIIFGESSGSGASMPLHVESKERRCAVVGATDSGQPIVRVVDTYLSHFALCDDPERFRKT